MPSPNTENLTHTLNTTDLGPRNLPVPSCLGPIPSATHDRQFEQILARLSDCEGLVQAELEAYRTVDLRIDTRLATDFLVSVIIPVFNEAQTIARVVSRVAALPLPTEIVVVDDNSTDGTREILRRISDVVDLKVILKELNQGKGAALRTGFAQATGDFIVVQDADLEYDPIDIPRLLEPLISKQADVVYGSRFIGEETQDESLVHRLGNAMLTGASNLLNGLQLTDMETCYKAFTKEVIESIRLDQDRFGVEPEITAKLARRGFQFVEVPISYNSRGYDEGKKIGIKDLFNALYCIGRYGVSD
jgi:glycosyltransferase involved in cell wall biosynthesis